MFNTKTEQRVNTKTVTNLATTITTTLGLTSNNAKALKHTSKLQQQPLSPPKPVLPKKLPKVTILCIFLEKKKKLLQIKKKKRNSSKI